MATEMKLSPPWLTYYHEMEAMFKSDKDISVTFDDESMTLRLFVEGEEKADALTKLLPMKKEFGNVTLNIEVIPANMQAENKLELFQKAFKGNDIFRFTKETSGPFSAGYVVFKKEVVQFYNDNLGDVNGNKTTLYEDIARDVFGIVADVYFCTEGGSFLCTEPERFLIKSDPI